MPGTETRTVDGWPVTLTRRANAKRLVLRVDEKRNGFALTVPARAPAAEVDRFLASRRAWMAQAARDRLLAWTPVCAPGERHLLLGRRVTLGEDGVPAGRAFLLARRQALAALVRQLLPEWERRIGVRASAVRFRDMRSRWGSCQPVKREIHLSAMLGEIPPACVEFILVHELCHLLHADHGPAFRAAMTRFLPDWEARRRELAALDRRPWPPCL